MGVACSSGATLSVSISALTSPCWGECKVIKPTVIALNLISVSCHKQHDEVVLVEEDVWTKGDVPTGNSFHKNS